MNSEQRLTALKRLKGMIGSDVFRASIPERHKILNEVLPLLKFDPHYYSNAVEVGDVLFQSGFSSSMYDRCHARLDSLVGQAIAELEQNLGPSQSLPNIQRARETQLAACPVISSLVFDLADSDTVRSIIGKAGLEVDW